MSTSHLSDMPQLFIVNSVLLPVRLPNPNPNNVSHNDAIYFVPGIVYSLK